MGGKRISVLTNGALSRAARSGCWTAQFFGTASKNTKITTTSKTMPSTTPQRAEEVLGHDADQGGRDQLADQDQQQDRVEEVGRVLDQPGQLAGAAALLVDQRLGLDPAHAHEARLGHGQHARAGQEHDDDDDEDGVLGLEARRRQERGARSRPRTDPVEALQQLLLERLHPFGLGVLLVVHAEQVEQPVHDQQRHLVVERDLVLLRVAAATDGQMTTSPSSVSAPSSADVPGPGAAEVGRAPGRARLVLDGERQHVGRPVLPRNCSLSWAMASSSTKSSETSVSPLTPRAVSTWRASSAQRATSIG